MPHKMILTTSPHWQDLTAIHSKEKILTGSPTLRVAYIGSKEIAKTTLSQLNK